MNHDPASTSQPSKHLEWIREHQPTGGFRAVLFDFDGTLSLLRRNWQDVMIPMMVDTLLATGTNETRDQLSEFVEEFVMCLNGRQTIFQMIRLAEEVSKRGGTPRDPLEYKRAYHALLWEQVVDRVASVREGRAVPDEMMVPGSRELLQKLSDAGLELYLASGTDLKYVRNELEVLGLRPFFGEHVYGALDNYHDFSKARIIRQMVQQAGNRGERICGFGDGFVEIEEIKRVGGLAVGVASDENRRQGIDAWKRARLIRAGADIIIGDYRRPDELLRLIHGGGS